MIDIEKLTSDLVDLLYAIYLKYTNGHERVKEAKKILPDMTNKELEKFLPLCRKQFLWDRNKALLEDTSIPEEFEPLPGEEIRHYKDKYYVTSLGRIFSKTVKGFNQLDEKINSSGYPCVNTKINDSSNKILVHRAVAETFIPNPLGFTLVDHIDTNKLNYSISNLHWVDSVENMANKITRENLKKGRESRGRTIALQNAVSELMKHYSFFEIILELTKQEGKNEHN